MQIKGLTVEKVLVTAAADIATEAYVGIIVDRASKRPVFMVSPAGGIDIEEVAAKTPEKIMRLPVDPRYGLQAFEAMQMGFFLYEDVKQARAAAKIMQQLYRRRSSTAARRSPRSIRWSRRPPARCSRSTRRWSSTTTSSIAARSSPRCATRRPRIPSEVARAEGKPHLHQARRQRRLRRQRRRPRDGDDGPREVLRRRAGELPRHRRLVQPGEGRRRAPRSSPATRT